MARRVFLHIGTPKSGTTYLQQVMGGNRERLAEQGVLYAAGRYPGDRVWATEELRGRDHSNHPKPHAAGAWNRIVEQARGWDGTAVISHEFFCACTAEQAGRALADLAPAEVHLVLTARDYVRQATAAWQERLKFRHTTRLGDFTLDDMHSTPLWSWRTQDVVAILDRWGQNVDPERIHVITVPQPGGPSGALWERFTGLVGIDPSSCDPAEARSNTSLGVAEVELLRRVNERIGDDVPTSREASKWVRDLLADRILAARGGERFSVRPEVARCLRDRSAEAVEQLRLRGYDVIGDLGELVPPDDGPVMRHPDDVPDADMLDPAIDTIAGMLREVQRQTRRAERAEQAARRARTSAGDAPARSADQPRSARQTLLAASERYPLLMKARAGYRRARNTARGIRNR